MGIFNKNEESKKDNDYNQSELREFYYKRMNEQEIKKLKELNLDEEIKKIQNSNYQIKYIDSIGYVFIGEGYTIIKDGTESTHYFSKIYNDQEEAKNEILKEYNEKVVNEEKQTIGSIRKTLLDENGMPYEVEEKLIIPDSEQETKKFTLKQLIKENAGPDPFWEDCINDFFNNVNKTVDEKIEFLKNLSLDQYLFNEFTKEIVKPLNVDQIFEKYNRLISKKNVDEFNLKIKEYTVSYENEDSYIVLISNEKIQINNVQVKEDVTAKVNKIKNVVFENLNEINKMYNSVQNSYRGGRQKQIDIRINGKDYYIIGNTDNEEAVKLYSILKEKIYKIINNESVVEKITDQKLKKIVEEVIGNNDPYWNEPVYDIAQKIISLPNGTETTIVKLLNNSQYTSEQLFDIYNSVFDVCKRIDINMDSSKWKGKIAGLPYNIPFIIKRILKCPNCGERLTYLMPSGSHLYCDKCNKYYKNDNGNVGEETENPHTKKDVLY